MLALLLDSCYNETCGCTCAGSAACKRELKKREGFLQMNFFGNDFQAWKLHSLADYVNILVFILAGLLVLKFAIRHMNKQRNHEAAVKKVVKKLKRLAKRPSKLYENAEFHFPDGKKSYDAVVADRSGIYIVKAYGWGTKIYGAPEGEVWRREDPRRKEEFPNPLIELKDGAERIRAVLRENGIDRIKIMPLVVFADNYQTPELYLGYGSFSTTYQELKGWYKMQSGTKEVQYDFERVVSILEKLQGMS